MAALPVDGRSVIWAALHERWDSAFFELIVARILQELGATITLERTNAQGKRPDFWARFEDGEVIFEAACLKMNAEVSEKGKRREPLLNIIEVYAPYGWYVHVLELPDLGPNDSKKQFEKAVVQMLEPNLLREQTGMLELVERLPNGVIRLNLHPASPGSHRLASEPGVWYLDNMKDRIRSIVRHKREQVRCSDVPVLLAIDATAGADIEDFDQALYGQTFQRSDWELRLIETGFDPNGEFTYNLGKDKPPTYAGVLAFLEVGFRGITGPVLYSHPRFSGILPKAILGLDQRYYDDNRRAICSELATDRNLLSGLGFVS